MIDTGRYRRCSARPSHTHCATSQRAGIELGEGGRIPLGDLVTALQKHEPKFASLRGRRIFLMLEGATKVRHEVGDGMIRALHVHSVRIASCASREVPPQRAPCMPPPSSMWLSNGLIHGARPLANHPAALHLGSAAVGNGSTRRRPQGADQPDQIGRQRSVPPSQRRHLLPKSGDLDGSHLRNAGRSSECGT